MVRDVGQLHAQTDGADLADRRAPHRLRVAVERVRRAELRAGGRFGRCRGDAAMLGIGQSERAVDRGVVGEGRERRRSRDREVARGREHELAPHGCVVHRRFPRDAITSGWSSDDDPSASSRSVGSRIVSVTRIGRRRGIIGELDLREADPVLRCERELRRLVERGDLDLERRKLPPREANGLPGDTPATTRSATRGPMRRRRSGARPCRRTTIAAPGGATNVMWSVVIGCASRTTSRSSSCARGFPRRIRIAVEAPRPGVRAGVKPKIVP